MTKENAKRNYDHFMEHGMIKQAENILIRHPEFKEEEKKETKSKEKK